MTPPQRQDHLEHVPIALVASDPSDGPSEMFNGARVSSQWRFAVGTEAVGLFQQLADALLDPAGTVVIAYDGRTRSIPAASSSIDNRGP